MDVAGRSAAGLDAIWAASGDRDPPFRIFRRHGTEGPDRPAEAAAQPPSEGKGGLKQYRRLLTFSVWGASGGDGSRVVVSMMFWVLVSYLDCSFVFVGLPSCSLFCRVTRSSSLSG